MTVSMILGIFLVLFGLYYVLRPRAYLKKRFERAGAKEIPKAVITTARISGAVCVVGGLAVIVIELMK